MKYTYEIYISSTDDSRKLRNYFKRCKQKFFILNFQSLVLIPPQSVYKKDFAMNWSISLSNWFIEIAYVFTSKYF